MRNLKIFGLALLALVAVNAISAMTASADEFTATKYPASVTGVNESGFTDEFTTTAGTVKCQADYVGTLKEKDTKLTISPTYTSCTGFGFPATVEMGNCDYLFRIEGGTSTTGTVDLECTSGEVTVTAKSGATVKCVVHVPAQTNLGTVTYTNIGTAGETEEITVNAALKNIKYSHTAGTGVGACTSGSGTTGSLNAKATVTGKEDGGTAHIGLILSNA